MSGKTSLTAVLVHAVVFYVLLSMRRQIPVINMIFEGFEAQGEMGQGIFEATLKISLQLCSQSKDHSPGFHSHFPKCANGKSPKSWQRQRFCLPCSILTLSTYL
jgi:hypothetical protein